MKLIIRAPNWVGDAIMAMPAIDIARDLTGASHIVIMARNTVASLFKHQPDINRIITIHDQGSKISSIREAAALIRRDRFEVGIILPSSFSSALIFKLGKVKGRAGYRGEGRSLLLTRAIKLRHDKIHRSENYLYLFEKVTGRKLESRPPRIYLSHEDIDEGAGLLKLNNLSYDDRYLAMAPQAVAPSRRWGLDNYASLACKIAERYGARVILLGSASDFDAAEAVKSGNEAIVNLCGQTSLLSAAAILSFAQGFVGNDSGLAHLAGATCCPIVVLSGPDDPQETSPICGKKNVIIKDLDCISCVKNECPKTGDKYMRCMKLITVDEVLNAVEKTFKI